MSGYGYPWAVRDSTSPRECLCMVCGRDYPVWFAPNDIWNHVMRDVDGAEATPFVCPTCFAMEAEARGIVPLSWSLTPREVTR